MLCSLSGSAALIVRRHVHSFPFTPHRLQNSNAIIANSQRNNTKNVTNYGHGIML